MSDDGMVVVRASDLRQLLKDYRTFIVYACEREPLSPMYAALSAALEHDGG